MIRIKKPRTIPIVLKKQGRQKTQKDCKEYNTLRHKYNAGTCKFKFSKSIYSHKSIRELLFTIQYGKCCYCEAELLPTSYGEIEHYRPKTAYSQDENDTLHYPGYYWLAYEWSNLLLACKACNNRYKRCYFPLVNNEQRAKSHKDRLRNEEPLLINPAIIDPELHITFHEEIVVVINGSEIGQTTIRFLGLDSRELERDRYKWIEKLKFLRKIARSNIPESLEAKLQLQNALQDSSQYASMARALMKDWEIDIS